MKQMRAKWSRTVVAAVVAGACTVAIVSGATARDAATCTPPRLVGLSVEKARHRVSRSGCVLRLRGARLTASNVQTIARTRHRGATITAWVNPMCSTMGAPGPPRGEPKITRGPTELVSGLYLAGGPHRFVSVPDCAKIAGVPGAGTITVRDPSRQAGGTDGAGVVVATQTVSSGHLARIRLAPGTYTVSGVCYDATINGKHGESRPMTVTIPAGRTVRDDVVLPIP